MVLGGRPNHGGTAYVDLLDRLVEWDAFLRDGGLERVQVHRDQVDRADPVGRERLLVCGQVAAGEDASVDERVECLYPSVEHLGEPCHLGDLANVQPGGRERSGRATGRDELDAQVGETTGEIDESSLVGDGDK